MSNRVVRARINKNDEFYTRYEDIATMNKYIVEYLEGKILYFPCDDYRYSNFVKYYKTNFNILKLKGIYASNLDIGEGSFIYAYDGKSERVLPIENGSFDSDEVLGLYSKSDIVITNPPFSLKMNFLKIVEERAKRFIFISPMNSFFKETHLKIIYMDRLATFDGREGETIACAWFNNFIDLRKELKLKEGSYDIDELTGYRVYNRSNHIPMNYYEPMLVPVTYKFFNNFKHFEHKGHCKCTVKGVAKYTKYLVQNPNPNH